MNCAEVQECLVDFLLLELDEHQRQAVEYHLSGNCQACNEELNRLREAQDLVWQSVPRLTIPKSLTEDVLKRISVSTSSPVLSSDFGEQGRVDISRSRTKSLRLQSWLAFAAGIVVMICVEPLLKETRAPVPTSLHLSEKRFERTRFVSLHKQPDERELRGYLLWDELSSEFHLYCFGMRQPLDGQQYALWLVGPANQLKVVDRLQINLAGIGKAAFNWPAGDFQFVLITLESSARKNDRPSDAIELTSCSIQSLNL